MQQNSRWFLIIGFIITQIIFIGVISYGLSQFENIRTHSRQILENNNSKSKYITSMLSSARERVIDLYAMINTEDAFARDDIFLEFTTQGYLFMHSRNALITLKLSADEKKLIEQQKQLSAVSIALQNDILDLIQIEQFPQATLLLNKLAIDVQYKVLKKLIEILDIQQQASQLNLNKIDGQYAQTSVLLIFWTFLSIALGAILAYMVIRRVSNIEKSLYLANTNLEQRVSDRTQTLQITNKQLNQSLSSLAETQEQLIQSEKMAALGNLVAGISHEINTPIGVSVTSASLVAENVSSLENRFLSGKLTKNDFQRFVNKTQQGIEILVSNLKRASDLIRSFKQVAVDQSCEENRTIDLKSYCDEIILSLHPKLKKTKIKVKNIIEDNMTIYTNPGALYQIISNLVINSLLHAFNNDEILQPSINIKAQKLDNMLILFYYDNGVGVEADLLAKIFDPFYTTKRGQGGSGLGMNIVYNLVTTSLAGSIKLSSVKNKGLHVTIKIPVNLEANNNEQ